MTALEPLRRYAEFSGRSRRSEYWLWMLLQAVVFITLSLLTGAEMFARGPFGYTLAGPNPDAMVPLGAAAALAALVIIPNIAVQVRRLHDSDRSGWWLLLYAVPILGSLILLIFFLLDGSVGPNRYGHDPRGRVLRFG
jgi:uncharacterized membrane protein YhaH (DUF805 family)